MSGFRAARRDDISAIVGLLDDDEVAAGRESLDDMIPYVAAFDAIAADPNNALYVWEHDGVVVGCLQLTFLPGLSYRGRWLAQVEGVRVARALRSAGIGAKMMAEAEALARRRGCAKLQLTSNKQRTAAHRFYERLGFARSHEGMAKML